MYRAVLVVFVAACRLHFDNLPLDASGSDAPAGLALACNTPVHVADGPAAVGAVTASTAGSTIDVGWIDVATNEYIAKINFVAPEQVTATAGHDPMDVGYTVLAAASDGTTIVGAYTVSSVSYVEVLDRNLQTIGGPTQIPFAPVSSRAIAMTGAASGAIAAVTTVDTSGNTVIYGVHADGTPTPPLNIPTAGSGIVASELVNIGDRLAVVNATAANNCFVRTIDAAISSTSAATGWGTANECTQPHLGYSPGRADALLVRHDLTDVDLNHVIATRNGLPYTIPGEMRLRTPGNEARPIGVADGYWVSYETGGTLEAAHVDFLGTVGTVAPLGPLTNAAAHTTVIEGGEPYAVWLQDGLEIAHLCE